MTNPPPAQYVRTADGVNIAYWVRGSGPLLVSMPAPPFGAGPGPFGAFGEAVIERRTAVFYDTRGVGLSDRDATDFTLEGMVRDLEAVVLDLPRDQFILYAPTMLGPTAIAYAARHPERVSRLVLLNTFARATEYAEQARVATLRETARGDWEAASEALTSVLYRLPAGAAARLRDSVEAETFNAMMAAFAEHDASGLMSEVQSPTLIVHGAHWRQGKVEFARELAAGIPNARLAIIEGESQRDENWQAWFAAVDGFLAEGEQPEAAELLAAAGDVQTILFTDLEGSTALTQRLGDEGAQELLRGHNTAVRAALEANGGREVKHTGDGIMASFPSAVAAVQAGIAIQRELMGAEVRVRVGLNAGEPIAEDDDLFGTAVQLAARITDRAEPGQVLVSRVVRDLCAGKTFEFTSIGEATLKGFDEPVELYEVRA